MDRGELSELRTFVRGTVSELTTAKTGPHADWPNSIVGLCTLVQWLADEVEKEAEKRERLEGLVMQVIGVLEKHLVDRSTPSKNIVICSLGKDELDKLLDEVRILLPLPRL